MKNLLYAVAFILMMVWAFGYLGFEAGGKIHLLIVLAMISVWLGLLQRKPPSEEKVREG